MTSGFLHIFYCYFYATMSTIKLFTNSNLMVTASSIDVLQYRFFNSSVFIIVILHSKVSFNGIIRVFSSSSISHAFEQLNERHNVDLSQKC